MREEKKEEAIKAGIKSLRMKMEKVQKVPRNGRGIEANGKEIKWEKGNDMKSEDEGEGLTVYAWNVLGRWCVCISMYNHQD